MESGFNKDQQLGAIAVLCYLEALFGETPRESFSRDEILYILDLIGQTPEMFESGMMDAFRSIQAP